MLSPEGASSYSRACALGFSGEISYKVEGGGKLPDPDDGHPLRAEGSFKPASSLCGGPSPASPTARRGQLTSLRGPPGLQCFVPSAVIPGIGDVP